MDVLTSVKQAEEAASRWRDLELLQKHYENFDDFLLDVIEGLMGFSCTEIQQDIADFLASDESLLMVQAQRGQAKTTITAAYAVWRLIHNPTVRVLILSAGDNMAQQISNWIIQIIMTMEELECMRPDTSHGDRASVKAFDVHWMLKGPEKSPSVACLGITANTQGFRADILIADDIESAKNSQTAVQRERIVHLTRDFTSICSNGQIIFLGTPQNSDSVYNTLASRGYKIRIWPGRYPTEEELPNYREWLAPLILERIKADPSLQTGGGPTGTRGKPVDPVILDEESLTAKEIDQGRAYFQLQHMLDTKLMDSDRFPLKASSIIFHRFSVERGPILLDWSPNPDNRIIPPMGFPLQENYYECHGSSEEFGYFLGPHMYIDPAGGGKNGDELAYGVTKLLAGKIWLAGVDGIPGGYDQKQIAFITDAVLKFKPKSISIEKNMGNGAFWKILQPHLNAALAKVGHHVGIEEVWETGQKELRIIDIMEPVISGHKLIVDPTLIEADWKSVQKYPTEVRSSYSFFYQLARITRDKGSMLHDDRIDAVAGAVRFFVDALAQDENKVAAKIKTENYARLINNPLGNGRPVPGFNGHKEPNALDKFKRRT